MVAVVPQSFDIDYDFTVEDIVLMGRNPYLSYKDREGAEDYRIVEQAMKMTKTLGFRGRMFNELSGGEKQRVIIARAIARSRILFCWMSPPPRWMCIIRSRLWSLSTSSIKTTI